MIFYTLRSTLFPYTTLFRSTKRAAYSIPMNIAEGCGRNTDKDFVHFLDTALGSVHELEYCGLLIFELGFIKKTLYETLKDRKSTRLNSSHRCISYAVFCLKK